jgi:transposase-like protein
MRPYSEAVKADVHRRMSPPQRQSVAEIARDLGIHVITLYKWRKAWRLLGEAVPASKKEPEGPVHQSLGIGTAGAVLQQVAGVPAQDGVEVLHGRLVSGRNGTKIRLPFAVLVNTALPWTKICRSQTPPSESRRVEKGNHSFSRL